MLKQENVNSSCSDFVSHFTLSAQLTDPQCTGTFDTAFNSNTTCTEAYDAVLYGNATDEQRMMVCNADQQCKAMIESIIFACSNMVSLYVVYDLANMHIVLL